MEPFLDLKNMTANKKFEALKKALENPHLASAKRIAIVQALKVLEKEIISNLSDSEAHSAPEKSAYSSSAAAAEPTDFNKTEDKLSGRCSLNQPNINGRSGNLKLDIMSNDQIYEACENILIFFAKLMYLCKDSLLTYHKIIYHLMIVY